jgi:polyhydroxyalkanoate synthesis regulator phasin
MTQDPAAGQVPDPAANREQWQRDHPDAGTVTQGQAQQQVADQLGGAAPAPGVSDQQLGQQMADAGATAGLPHESAMDAMMEEIRRLSERVTQLQENDRQRTIAVNAQLGPPELIARAEAVRDKINALVAANPGSSDHFRQLARDAEALARTSSDAIDRGANDLGQVNAFAARVDRFLNIGHKRTAPGHLAHVDLSAIAYDLELLIEEAQRLAPGAPPVAARVPALTAG